MATVYGSVGENVEGEEEWSLYLERLEHFCSIMCMTHAHGWVGFYWNCVHSECSCFASRQILHGGSMAFQVTQPEPLVFARPEEWPIW